jgi:hypothetical protein
MYIDTVPNRNSPPAVLLRQSSRVDHKIVKRTLANLSDWPTTQVDLLRRVLKGEALASASEALEIERSLPHGHVAAALGTLRHIGLESDVARSSAPQRDLVCALIVARMLTTASQPATARGLREQTRRIAQRHGETVGEDSSGHATQASAAAAARKRSVSGRYLEMYRRGLPDETTDAGSNVSAAGSWTSPYNWTASPQPKNEEWPVNQRNFRLNSASPHGISRLDFAPPTF